MNVTGNKREFDETGSEEHAADAQVQDPPKAKVHKHQRCDIDDFIGEFIDPTTIEHDVDVAPDADAPEEADAREEADAPEEAEDADEAEGPEETDEAEIPQTVAAGDPPDKIEHKTADGTIRFHLSFVPTKPGRLASGEEKSHVDEWWRHKNVVEFTIGRKAREIGAKYCDYLIGSGCYLTFGKLEIRVDYERAFAGDLYDLEGQELVDAAEQLVYYAKDFCELHALNAEEKLGVELAVKWDGIEVTDEQDVTRILRYSGEVGGERLLSELTERARLRKEKAVLSAAAAAEPEEPLSAPIVERCCEWSFNPERLRLCLSDLYGSLHVKDYTEVVTAISYHLMGVANERGDSKKAKRLSVSDPWSEPAPVWRFGPEKLRGFYDELAYLPVDDYKDVEKAVDTHLKVGSL